MKLFPKNRLFISLLTSSISSAFLLTPTYAMDPPLKEEELNKFSLSRALPLAVRERLGSDIFSFKYYNTAHELLQSNNPEDKEIGMAALSEIVRDSNNPQYLSAANYLMRDTTELSEPTLLNLLPLFSLENEHEHNLGFPLLSMLESQYPVIKEKAETIFLNNPLKFMDDYFLGPIHDFLVQENQSKRDLYLRKICEEIKLVSLKEADETNATFQFNASCLVLRMSDQEQVVLPAHNMFLKLMNTEVETFISQANSVLKCTKDINLKEQIISKLFNIAKRAFVEENSEDSSSEDSDDSSRFPRKSLIVLLKQNDEKIRTEAISLCQKLVESMHPIPVNPLENFLSKMGLALIKCETGQSLVQEVYSLLHPAFNQLLLQSESWSKHLTLLEFFMKIGTQEQQLDIYNLLKKSIIEVNDEDHINALKAANLMTYTVGMDHLWTQELIELATKRENVSHPKSPFAVYKHLCEQISQPVKHLLPSFQLVDKRFVTFNLKTLQDSKAFCLDSHET